MHLLPSGTGTEEEEGAAAQVSSTLDLESVGIYTEVARFRVQGRAHPFWGIWVTLLNR